MVDFSALKNKRGSNLASLTEKLEGLNKSQSYEKDERIFKPGFDKKEAKGYAVVRFLPNKQGNPFERIYSYNFNTKVGYYIENSRQTIGEDDPVALSNKFYWDLGEATGDESKKNIARGRKRQTRYYANVFVVKDTVNPEHNGKVMIYEFGQQIFKLIEKAAKPEFEDDEPFDPFDMWSGADLKIKIVGKEIPGRNGQKVLVPNYEDSEFAKITELFDGDDAKKEELFNQTYDLAALVKIKPFEELAARFEKVAGEKYNRLETANPVQDEINKLKTKTEDDLGVQNSQIQSDKDDDDLPPFMQDSKSDEDDEDEMLKRFKQLASQ